MNVIETKYRGFRFRSRLEARWAVFMDAMGVAYEYEREAYDLDGLFYLPDFWLPQIKAHLEIKPEMPTEEETEKARRLAEHTKCNVFILHGPPQVPPQDMRSCYGDSPNQAEVHIVREDGEWVEEPEAGWILPDGFDPPFNSRFIPNGNHSIGWDAPYLWCECPHCHRCELEFDGRADRIKCRCPKSEHGDKGYNHDSDRLLDAYARASSYRFEPRAYNDV